MQHINDIEYSWRHVKYCLLHVVHGVPKHTVHLHLKETGVRFNSRYDDLYKVLLKML